MRVLGGRWIRIALGSVIVAGVSACTGNDRLAEGARGRRDATLATAARVDTTSDTLLLATSRAIVRARRVEGDGASYRLSIVQSAPGDERELYHVDSLPVLPFVTAFEEGRESVILWTIGHEDLSGGALVRVRAGTARVVWHGLAPEGGLCLPPTIAQVRGRPVLLLELAAVFSASSCIDPVTDCPGQFLSTWPRLLRLAGDSLRDVTAEEPQFLRDRAAEYERWAKELRQGAIARGQRQLAPQSITARCGTFTVDSLSMLAKRARYLANLSPAK